jgi:hypothetical protein
MTLCFLIAICQCLLTVAGSPFSPLLSRDVSLDSTDRVENPHIETTFLNCHFQNINYVNGTGGAISSDRSVCVFLCSFTSICASYGGAIACSSDLRSLFSSYIRITSLHGFGLFSLADDAEQTQFEFNAYHYILIGENSAFKKFGGGLDVLSCNFTDFIAKGCLPGCDVGANTPKITHCVMHSVRAHYRMGALSLWLCKDFVITVTFVNISIAVPSDLNALVCWLDGSDQTGTFENCNLIASEVTSGKCIYCFESNRVSISNCRFCIPMEQCRNNHQKIVILNSTRFDVISFPPITPIGAGNRDVDQPPIRRIWNLDFLFTWFPLAAFALLAVQVVVDLGIPQL